ncbi:MAG: GmrSD restriction endonuclease domain-containing protein, partial [Alphaproteobacteria bacterium]
AVTDSHSFVRSLDEVIESNLTSDYWSITLPTDLATSSARNPQLFAYVAAQNRLGAPVLFSHKKIGDLIDPALKPKKKALERHHLFPRAWLERQGVDDLKVINQMANFALLEWPDNIDISDTPPSEYVPQVRARFADGAWADMCTAHGLPKGWENMGYDEFLVRRRVLMADIVRRGFETLK